MISQTGCNFTCPEDINAGGRPFSVWTRLHRLGGFWSDTMLRVECRGEVEAAGCCDNIRSVTHVAILFRITNKP